MIQSLNTAQSKRPMTNLIMEGLLLISNFLIFIEYWNNPGYISGNKHSSLKSKNVRVGS